MNHSQIKFTLFTKDGYVKTLVNNITGKEESFKVLELPPENNNPIPSVSIFRSDVAKPAYICVDEKSLSDDALEQAALCQVVFPSATHSSSRMAVLPGSVRAYDKKAIHADVRVMPMPIDTGLGFTMAEIKGIELNEDVKSVFTDITRRLFAQEPPRCGLGFSKDALQTLAKYGDDDHIDAGFDAACFERPEPGLPPSDPCFAGIYTADGRVYFVVYGGAAESTREQWCEVLRQNTERVRWDRWASREETSRLRALSRRIRIAVVECLENACGGARQFERTFVHTDYTYLRFDEHGVTALYDATDTRDATAGGVLALETSHKNSELVWLRGPTSSKGWTSSDVGLLSRSCNAVPRVLCSRGVLKQVHPSTLQKTFLKCVLRVDWNE